MFFFGAREERRVEDNEAREVTTDDDEEEFLGGRGVGATRDCFGLTDLDLVLVGAVVEGRVARLARMKNRLREGFSRSH